MNAATATEIIDVIPLTFAYVESLAELTMQKMIEEGHFSVDSESCAPLKESYINHKKRELKKPEEAECKTILAVNGEDIVIGMAEYKEIEDAYVMIETMFAKDRRHGAGKVLMDYMKAEALKIGAKTLEVNALGQSYLFYQKMGFVAKNPETLPLFTAMSLVLDG